MIKKKNENTTDRLFESRSGAYNVIEITPGAIITTSYTTPYLRGVLLFRIVFLFVLSNT